MIFRDFFMLLKRYTTSSVLNIAGLGIAFASAYLMLVQVNYDLSYNRGIAGPDRIYRLEYPSWYGDHSKYGIMWNRQTPLTMASAVPEIASIACMHMAGWDYNVSIRREDTIENWTLQLAPTEAAGFDVFGIEIVDGSVDKFKNDDMALSESAARKYRLGVGDVLHWGKGAGDDSGTVTVRAIYRDLPEPSAFDGNDGMLGMVPAEQTDESNWNSFAYLRLNDGASPADVAAKMLDGLLATAEKRGAPQEELDELRERMTVRLNPLADLYFSRNTDGADGAIGNSATTYTLLGLACLVIVIAFINFVNFFFALVPVRIRSVNTRKIFGASTVWLRLGFVAETAGLIAASLLVAFGLVLIFADLPISDYISTDVGIGANASLALGFVAGALALGVAISVWPAFYITSFSPAFVIKGAFSSTSSGRVLRYTLVGMQYVISIALIIAALFIRMQHSYMMNYDMGFDSSMLLSVDNVSGLDYARRDALFDKLKSNPIVEDAAMAAGDLVAPLRMGWGRRFKDNQIQFQCYPVSWNLLRVMGIDIIEGRDFIPSDEQYERGTFIFNDAARRQFDITLEDLVAGHRGDTRVAGFCEDFNFKPLQYGIEPFAFYVFGSDPWQYPSRLYVRVSPGADIRAARRHIENTVKEVCPYLEPGSVEARLFDAELEFYYRKEERLSTLITIFSLLSILISMMGVFGLVLFETQYRRKEIGIRRVNGATVGEILRMFNLQFLRVVGVCSVIAVPVSWYFVDSWLSGFAYRMPMHWWVFVLSAAIVAAITVVTVTARSWSASNENPVNAIQH